MSETSASAATPQGSALANPRDAAAEGAPAGVPQRWQKRAPGLSGAAHPAQAAPPFGSAVGVGVTWAEADAAAEEVA